MNENKTVTEVREWRTKVYEDTKNMSNKKIVEQARKQFESDVKEFGFTKAIANNAQARNCGSQPR